jgi:CubicO group peptidase (beta-lactamase class C family)
MIRGSGQLGGVRIPRALDGAADAHEPGGHAPFDERTSASGSPETTDRYGANGMDSVGAFGWGGAYGTVYRSDPEARLTILLMVQLLPNATDVREKVPALVYQAFVDPVATGLKK